MAFGFGGAGGGAADALTQILAERRAAFLQQQAEQERRQAAEESARRFNEQMGLQRSQEQRLGRKERLEEAALTMGQLDAQGQGATVSPDAAAALQGTPFAARLDQKRTLPGVSRMGDPSVGMTTQVLPEEGYTTVKPT